MSVDVKGYCTYGGTISAQDFMECIDIDKFAKRFEIDDVEAVDIQEIIFCFNLEDFFIDDVAFYSDEFTLYYGVCLYNRYDLSYLERDIEEFESYMIALGNVYDCFDYDKFIEKTEDQVYTIHIFEHWY